MVKDSERQRAYHPRRPHKEGCLCVTCKARRGVGEIITPPPEEPEVIAKLRVRVPPPPAKVRLGSLKTKDLFELNGLRYRVGEKTPEVMVCAQLVWHSDGPLPSNKSWRLVKTVPLGHATMVKPIE